MNLDLSYRYWYWRTQRRAKRRHGQPQCGYPVSWHGFYTTCQRRPGHPPWLRHRDVWGEKA